MRLWLCSDKKVQHVAGLNTHKWGVRCSIIQLQSFSLLDIHQAIKDRPCYVCLYGIEVFSTVIHRAIDLVIRELILSAFLYVGAYSDILIKQWNYYRLYRSSIKYLCQSNTSTLTVTENNFSNRALYQVELFLTRLNRIKKAIYGNWTFRNWPANEPNC